ncbi:gluconokinase [Vibrio gallicus]|uniref:gluconokinase n=1 Tax=Vibrio gallicus TaxID=190897 RepID=UPI0021C4A6AF|nr:gluconokinase [Vibrio gallicus]
METDTAVFIIMGVSSTGKSTVGSMLATQGGFKFIDGDDLHPRENVLKMSGGEALNDEDRAPWLERIRDAAFSMQMKNENGVIVCSALKKAYRDKIREGNDNVVFLHLHANKEIIAERMENREGHFMPTDLLHNQFATLEIPTIEEAKTHQIDVANDIEQVVLDCITASQQYLG